MKSTRCKNQSNFGFLRAFERGRGRSLAAAACLLITFVPLSLQAEVSASRGPSATRDVSVAHVIMSAESPSHVSRVLDDVAALERSGVALGEIILVGRASISEALFPEELVTSTTDGNLGKLLRSKALGKGAAVDAVPILDGLSVKLSPTWVIRSRNADYVFEGEQRPRRLFTDTGEFRRDEFVAASVADLTEPLPLEISGGTARVAYRAGARSGVRFPTGGTLNASMGNGRKIKDLSVLGSSMQGLVRAATFRKYLDALPANAGLAVERQACSASAKRSIAVPLADEQFRNFDLIFYSPNSEQEAALASGFGARAQAYGTTDGSVHLANLLQVRCLPTRVRVRNDARSAAVEYLEGALAWSK